MATKKSTTKKMKTIYVGFELDSDGDLYDYSVADLEKLCTT